MILESPTKLIAKDNFLLEPPDNDETSLFYSSNNSVFYKISNISLGSILPLIPLINSKCSLTVKSLYKQSFYVHKPSDFLI